MILCIGFSNSELVGGGGVLIPKSHSGYCHATERPDKNKSSVTDDHLE